MVRCTDSRNAGGSRAWYSALANSCRQERNQTLTSDPKGNDVKTMTGVMGAGSHGVGGPAADDAARHVLLQPVHHKQRLALLARRLLPAVDPSRIEWHRRPRLEAEGNLPWEDGVRGRVAMAMACQSWPPDARLARGARGDGLFGKDHRRALPLRAAPALPPPPRRWLGAGCCSGCWLLSLPGLSRGIGAPDA